MNLASSIMDKIIPAFGWMLIHSLWEGLFFAIVAGVVLMMAKKLQAAYRSNIVLVLFLAFLSSCTVTFLYELNGAAVAITKPLLPGGGAAIPTLFFGNVRSIKQLVEIFTRYFSANEPLLVLIWFIFFLFKSVKMLACLVYNHQIRTRQVFEPSRYWTEKVAEYSEKLQVKKAVRFLQSGYIKMPVVVGHLKPVILFPIGLLAGLPEEQVEAILLHELAHIRRNDYFVNFLQNITETIFFFNPGLLWISSLLREERENCCDDIALLQTQNKLGFVQALISFKEHELRGPGYAVAFPGKKNYLLRRVRRIMVSKNLAFAAGEKMFIIGSIVVLLLLATTVSIAQFGERVKNRPVAVRTDHVILKKAVAANNAAAIKSIAIAINHARANARLKMEDGIGGIKKNAEVISITSVEVTATTKPGNYQKDLSEQKQAELDQLQAKQDQAQARIDQEEAMKDQQQALRDQAQVKIDQAQALKDQAAARIDQLKGKKDKEAASLKNERPTNVNEEQAARNEEQVRLNKIQQEKNQEQAKRNQEQARLNQIQQQKNEEQAVRNQEQARLNQIQAKKNQQQAMKNKVSIQQ